MADRSILVIDGEALIRWALAKNLSLRGYRVETAGNADSARRAIESRRFDVVVVSIHLSDDNGLNLLPRIRSRDPSTHVIVLSGDPTPENKRRAFADGAWQFIEKPFEVSEIVGLLSSLYRDYPERRRDVRYHCRLPLRISVIETSPEEASLDLANLGSTSLDVGRGGLRLRTAYHLRVGQRIRVVSLQEEQPCAEFLPSGTIAEVVWSDRAASRCTAGLRRLETINPDRTS